MDGRFPRILVNISTGNVVAYQEGERKWKKIIK